MPDRTDSGQGRDALEVASTQGYCACRKVEERPLVNEDGTLTDRWVCTVCGCEFVRRAAVRKAAREMGEMKEAGVMYATVGIVNPCPTSRTECTIGVLLPWLQSGDRVRVTRIEEAP